MGDIERINSEDKFMKLQEDSAMEYYNCINNIFKRVNKENKIIERVEQLLLDRLNNEADLEDISTAGLLTIFKEVRKAENDLAVGLLNAVAKQKEGGLGSATEPKVGNGEANIDIPSSDLGITKAEADSARSVMKVMNLIKSMQDLEESEK